MNNKVEYGIEGAFKVDLFSGGQFVSTTDYFSNFITPTGLMYPNNYAFADCFRYLSLGRSTASHTGATGLMELGTTGLYDPIQSYTTSSNETQSAQYIGWEGYATGKSNSNCGTALSETGPRFYRAWYVPTGRTEVTINEPAGGGLMIGEFMVSPSSGQNSTGKYAFSRVVRDLFIPNGFRAIVSYQLKVNIRNTGVTYFSGGSFNTTNAEISNDAAIVATWASLSGYYKQVYHGLRCVDNLGLTYIPKYGDGMEPASNSLSKMVWYLSPDNSQFDVNKNGGFQTSVNSAYQADGLMAHIKSLDLKTNAVIYPGVEALDKPAITTLYNDTIVSTDIFPTDNTLKNIRIGSSSQTLKAPDTALYKTLNEDNGVNFQSKVESEDIAAKTISYATPGKNGWSDFYSDFGKQAAFTSSSTKLPINMAGQNLITGRKKTITRKSVFSPISSLGYNTRFGSLVYAYEADATEEGNKTYYPVLDSLFFDSSGRSLMGHYRYISGIQLTERGTGIVEASLFLSGQIGSNIFRFTPRKTFQGPYSNPINHGLMKGVVWQNDPDSPTVFNYSGFPATGAFDSNATSGQTGSITLDGTVYSGGWGSVYGVIADSGFYDFKLDLGILDHNVANLRAPESTGQLYWPVISPENAMRLYVTGVKFYDPSIGATNVITDNSGWYGPSRQIVKDINFDVLNASYAAIPGTNYLKNVTGVLTGPDLCSGYFLSKTRYFNNQISLGDLVNNASVAFTGYIVPADRNVGGNKLKGGIWDDGGLLPTDRLAYVPTLTNTTVSGVALFKKVTQLFPTVADRGYPFGTGGTPIRANDATLAFFSGYSGATPLYLTMLSGSGTSIMGFSYLSGNVSTTNFASPTGYPYHGENSGSLGWKLLPNYSSASYYGEEPIIYTPTTGGEYPALSLDNGLEMYLDISWSSPCGPSVKVGSCFEAV